MKDKDNIIQFPLKIIERNEPHEIADFYLSKIEEAMLHYDMDDYRMEEAFLHLQQAIMWWNCYWED